MRVRIVKYLFSFLAGLLFGLVVMGWWLWPVQWKDASPADLHPDYRQIYLDMMTNEADLNVDQDQSLGSTSWSERDFNSDFEQGLEGPSSTETITHLEEPGETLGTHFDDSSEQPSVTDTENSGADNKSDTPFVTFTMTPSHQTLPEDVLREITFAGRGAEAGICNEGELQPTISPYPACLEPTCSLVAGSCGWQDGELVLITVKFPDGRLITETQEVTWDEYYDCQIELLFYYSIDLNDPIGTYTFTFEGESGKAETSFDVVEPVGPRIYDRETSLLLYNFEPNEHVRLFAYRLEHNVHVLTAWQEFQVDSSGQLIVQLKDDTDRNIWTEYLAIGDISGECSMYSPYSPNATVIHKPKYVMANMFDRQPLNVYASWPIDSHSVPIRQVASGTYMEVIEAKWNGYSHDWHVRLNDGQEGWVKDLDVERIPRKMRLELAGPRIPPNDVLQQIAFYSLEKTMSLQLYSDRLILNKFYANRALRILVYQKSQSTSSSQYAGMLRFVTEWYVVVEDQDYTELQVRGGALTQYDLIVIDAISGQVLAKTITAHNPIVPGGGWRTGSVVVANSGDDRLNIRSRPGYENEVIAKVHHGDTMIIVGNSARANNERWWPVLLSDNTEGWVTELWIAPVR